MPGTIVAITDQHGEIVAWYSCSLFGKVIEKWVTYLEVDISMGLAGQYGVLQELNGLYFMNVRIMILKSEKEM